MEIRTTNTILYCNKWQETVAFYKEKLQLKITVANDWFYEFELNEFSRLSVADASRTSLKSCKGKGITITFEVDDMGQIRDQLLHAEIHPPPLQQHRWGAQVLYIHDPEGNRIEFWRPD